MASKKTAIIIGAGPAGLAAAYELITRTDIKPIIFEASDAIGGLARTYKFAGNYLDIGGHRFFSKSKRVNEWWFNLLSPENSSVKTKRSRNNKIMLLRQRISRILFLQKLFAYPVKINWQTIRNLGLVRICKIVISYFYARISPRRPEQSLEDFFINSFGAELYKTFFKSYTEKVWGTPCDQLKSEWGAQRVKKLSVIRALFQHFKQIVVKSNNQKTSLVEEFWYPKFGPGQLWDELAAKIIAGGGEIHFNSAVVKLVVSKKFVTKATIKAHGKTRVVCGDYVFSTMPIKDLAVAFGKVVPAAIAKTAAALRYRDFIALGLLANDLKIKDHQNKLIPDNWIYVQESHVKLGRIQIFNNWSPYLLKDQNKILLDLEYFANVGDALWNLSDAALCELAKTELATIGFAEPNMIEKCAVYRIKNAYPLYCGTAAEFIALQKFFAHYANLFLIGRNGMHRYNNLDHAILSAMIAVDNIINGITTKDNIWAVNAESGYQEGN